MRQASHASTFGRQRKSLAMLRRVPALTLLAFLFTSGISSAQDAASFKVVANASNSVSSLTETEVSRLLLKKTTKWAASGAKVLPVDQLEKSSVRQTFSQEVHGKDVRAIKSYWQTQLFAGRATPPPELASDAEVLSYVRSNASAIGYVSKGAVVGDGVKIVDVTG